MTEFSFFECDHEKFSLFVFALISKEIPGARYRDGKPFRIDAAIPLDVLRNYVDFTAMKFPRCARSAKFKVFPIDEAAFHANAIFSH